MPYILNDIRSEVLYSLEFLLSAEAPGGIIASFSSLGLTSASFSLLQIKELGTSMLELWSIMDTLAEEQQVFQHITCLIPTIEDEIVGQSCLSVETIEQVRALMQYPELIPTASQSLH